MHFDSLRPAKNSLNLRSRQTLARQFPKGIAHLHSCKGFRHSKLKRPTGESFQRLLQVMLQTKSDRQGESDSRLSLHPGSRNSYIGILSNYRSEFGITSIYLNTVVSKISIKLSLAIQT